MQNGQEGQAAPGALGLLPSCCKLLFVQPHLELNKLWLRFSEALTPTGYLFQKFFLLFGKFLLIPSPCVLCIHPPTKGYSQTLFCVRTDFMDRFPLTELCFKLVLQLG